MSANIKGITLEIGGNTTKLQKALGEVNKNSRTLQKELKNVNRLLKLDPKNTELVAQKQKILAESVNNTKNKLDMLKKAEKQVQERFKAGKATEEQYRAIRQEVISTENKLKGLNSQLVKVNNTGSKISQVAEELREVEEKSRDLNKELVEVNRSLKLDPKNIELVSQKQKILSEDVETTKKELSYLKSMEKEVRKEFEKGNVGEEQYRKIKREVIDTENELKDLETQLKKVNSKWDDASVKMKKFGDKTSNLGRDLAPASAAAGAGGIAALKMASDFEDSVAKLSTVADTTKVPLDTLRKQILELSDDTGVSANLIAEDVYNAISAGQDTAEAVNFVSNSTKLSKAGFAESSQSLDLLTTVMNAYGDKASDVNVISDMLIQTQNKGKVTVGELSSSMGKLIPTANAVDVGLEQLTAGYALLTSNGIGAAEATTYMNSMFNELGKSGSKSDKVLKELTGKGFKDLSKEGKSVADILEIIEENAQENNKSLSDMFGSAEAGKAALVLMKEGSKGFNESVLEMQNSTGATGEAFEKLQTPGEELKKSLNKMKNAFMELGISVLPVLESLAEVISNLADKFGNMNQGSKKMIMVILAIVAGLAPLLIIIGKVASGVGALTGLIGPLIAGFGGATTGASGLSGAIALITGPIALVIAAIIAFIAIFVTLYKNNEDFKNKINLLWEEIKKIFSSTLKLIQDIITGFIELTSFLWDKYGDNIVAIFTYIWNLIELIVGNGVKIVSEIINFFIAVFTGDWEAAWEAFVNIFELAWDTLTELLPMLIDGLISIFKGSFSFFENVGEDIIDYLKTGLENAWSGVKSFINKSVDWLKEKLSFWNKSKDKMNKSEVNSEPKDYGDQYLNGSHANGLDYVPFDGYIAELHKGERVLTASENRGLKWYDKGGIFKSPSIIGVGEKRPEFVGALDDLKTIVKNAIAETVSKVEHTGTIRVEGYKNSGEFQDIVEIVMEQLKNEVRTI